SGYSFFFQAEDGIRDDLVTGVQTCALPISCQSTGDEQAIEIPNRQVVSFDVQLRMIKQRQRMQRIDVCQQVSADAIRVDEFHHRSEERRVGKECRYRTTRCE